MILTGSLCFGQNFFENENSEEPTENNQGSMFAEHTQPPANPDIGLDAQGQPNPGGDDVPIDDWAFLLPLAGILIGFYYLSKKKEIA